MKKKIFTLLFLTIIIVSSMLIFTGCEETLEDKYAPSIELVNPACTNDSISFEIIEKDFMGEGAVSKIELLHKEDAPIEAANTDVRSFENLLSGEKYTVRVTYTYTLKDLEYTDVKTLDITTEAHEKPEVKIINPKSTTESISFEIYEKDRKNICSIEKIELIQSGKDPIVAANTDTREFADLLADTVYTIKVTYKYNLNDGHGDKIESTMVNATTVKIEKPHIDIYITDKTASSITFAVDKEDIDGVCEINKVELYKGNTCVQSVGAGIRSFDKLNADTKYTVKVYYSYDINDSKGAHQSVASYDVYTEEIEKPFIAVTGVSTTGTTIDFEINEIDRYNMGEIVKIELYLGNYLIYETENQSIRGFMGLTSGFTYTVEISYEYDLNDGNGKQTDVTVLSVATALTGDDSADPDEPSVFPSYEGATINVACTTWSANPSYPWSTVELCVTPYSSSGFGELIDAAVLEREAFINQYLGVDVNFLNVSRYMLSDSIKTAYLAQNEHYELAMPRIMETHTLAVNGYVYDLANRDFIDLTAPYYRQETVKEFTVDGHTLFVGGDFSNLDIETAYVMYFNKNILGEEETENIYNHVFDGTWTFDKLVSYANSGYKDNGNGYCDDSDSYGLAVNSLDKFYEYFGVNHVSVNPDTEQFELTLYQDKVDSVIEAIIATNKSNWCRSSWGSNSYWGSNAVSAFNQGNIMFYNECVYNSRQLTPNFGVVPFPMLDEAQGRYYAPCSTQQATVMCIPKVTSDREMSEFFLEMLTATGTLYTMQAYYATLILERNWGEYELEVFVDYILPSISYDHGSTYGWTSILPDVRANSYAGNVNNFDAAYGAQEANALATLQKWNDAWTNYSDDWPTE